jgi:hypothetical protein
MQTIYTPNGAANSLLTAQKRLIRPVYAQTQGFPHMATLDPSLRNTDGSIRVPTAADTSPTFPLTRSAAAFTYQGSLIPGLVVVKTVGEQIAIANGANSAVQPWGLLGQWVGGIFDNVGQSNQVGVWMGPDSEYELLAPAWNDTTVAAAVAAAGAGQNVLLYAGADGRLTYTGSPGSQVPIARVIDRPAASRLVIQLLI